MKIFPSLISGDILNIERMIKLLDEKCDGYHIDVMDDHFVPNLTWGPMFVNAIGKITNRPLHVHLMVDNPENWLDRVTLKKDDSFIFHHESFFHVEEILALIKKVKKLSCGVGVALNPQTPVNEALVYLGEIDHVLLMSVNPGFSGQKFMPEVLPKVKILSEEREARKLQLTIGMDGGINLENIAAVANAGVDQVGVASAIFSSQNPVQALAKLYEKI